jgi:AAA domain
MESIDTNPTPISQGAAPMVAEPKTIEEVKALDAAWFAEHPDRTARLRKTYACEINHGEESRPDQRIRATVVWMDHTKPRHYPLRSPSVHFANGEPGEEISREAFEFARKRMIAKPTNIVEAWIADEEWLGMHPERTTRWRKSFPFEREPSFLHEEQLTAARKPPDGEIRWHLFSGLPESRYLLQGNPDEARADEAFRRYTEGRYAQQHYEGSYDRAEGERNVKAALERDEKEAREREEERRKNQELRELREREEAEKAVAEKAAAEQEAQEERDRLEREKSEQVSRKKRGKATFTDEAYEQLPGDLRLVTFRLGVEAEGDDNALQAIERVFGGLGCVNATYEDGYSVHVEIVTNQDLADRYLGADSIIVHGWTLAGVPFELVGDIEVTDRFTPRSNWTFGRINAVSDTPYQSGDFGRWLKAVTVTGETFAKTATQIDLRRGNVVSIARHLKSRDKKVEAQKFIVPGLIATDALTLLIGETGHGKSLILKQLACAISERESEWLGFPLDHTANNGGIVIFISGEEAEEKAEHDILKMLGRDELPENISVCGKERGTNLRAILDGEKDSKVAAVFIDSTVPYLSGSDRGDDNLRDFFNVVDQFASRNKGCVPIVAHHLKRDPKNTRLGNLLEWIRGTQVLLDRPRAILGLILRATMMSEFGVATFSNGMAVWNHAEPRFEGERRLQKDEATGRLYPVAKTGDDAKVDGEKGAAAVADETAEKVLTVVRRYNAKGERITRTNKSGVYATRAPELAGLARARVWETVDSLLEDGRTADGRRRHAYRRRSCCRPNMTSRSRRFRNRRNRRNPLAAGALSKPLKSLQFVVPAALERGQLSA